MIIIVTILAYAIMQKYNDINRNSLGFMLLILNSHISYMTDPVKKDRYHCSHSAGVHTVALPWQQRFQQFCDDGRHGDHGLPSKPRVASSRVMFSKSVLSKTVNFGIVHESYPTTEMTQLYL